MSIFAAWWMTAASSSQTLETSTTLPRSSEVRGTESALFLPPVHRHHNSNRCLFILWTVWETLLTVLCCVSLVTTTISLPTGLQTGLPLSVWMMCVGVCVCVCVSARLPACLCNSYVCSLGVSSLARVKVGADGENQAWFGFVEKQPTTTKLLSE